MGRWVPRTKLGCVLWSLWELLVQVLHSCLPRLFVGRRSLEGAEDELFAIRIFHGLNGPYFFSRGVEWAGWAHLRLINLAERYPPCQELGRAYAAHAVCLNGFPRLFSRGLRISKMGADLCEQLGDPWGQAQGLTFHAMMLHYMGRFAEAYEVGKKASALFDRTGDRWEANSGLDFAVDSLFRLGDMKEAVRLARHIWQRGHEIGDSHALAWSLDAWSRATDGRGVPKELLDAERARTDHFVQTAAALDQAEGVRLLGTGSAREAALLLEEARRRNLKEAGFFYDLNAPILVYLVAALRVQAEAVPPWAPQERARLLAEARRASKRAMSVAREFQNSLAHALREDALVAAMSGEVERARSKLEESIRVAEALAQRYESALSRQALGRLGEAHGWDGARTQREHAEEELQAIRLALSSEMPVDRPPTDTQTLSLVDLFATLLVAGRAVATALTPEAVYAELRHATLSLLRAERCVVLALRIDETTFDVTPVHGDGGLPIGMDLVRRAIARRHAVAYSASDLADPEIRRAAIRSVLCVPIIVRGSPWGCLYVVHGEVDELFGEPETRIGEFLGTLAGAALENAQGFSEIQGFSRALETRVAERTAELERANHELERNLRHLRQTQEQLLQAGKMAAVGTLIAGLSHELNNPLAVIVGYAHSLLLQLPSDTSSRKPLAAIERQATRCSLLVRALLNFSHANGSRRERVRLSVICDSVVQLVTGTARARDVRVETHIAPDAGPEVVVCPQEIESALLNLLTNAIDVSPPGRVIELEVRASTPSEEPGVEFAIRDSGPGIPAEVVPRIFDPFFTTKPVGQGTGLGLSLTRQIVQSHGGRIHVETAQGKGTCMVVWLPLTSGREVEGRFS
jgi:two-component system sensor kinase